MSRVFEAALIGRRKVAERTLELSFRRPDAFSFRPGQYMQVAVPKLLYPDRKGRSRVFSIASSPLDDEQLSIAFRYTGSGFKRTLKDLEMGAPVTIEGPHGFYVLPDSPPRPLALVAGGIGITPFLSMLRFATDNDYEPGCAITLVFANRNRKSAAYLEEMNDMASSRSYLRLMRHFGPIDAAALRGSVKDVAHCIWYVAGPPLMVDATRSALHSLGVDPGRVLFEGFVGY
jgi:ferredoxin-NADP reductase